MKPATFSVGDRARKVGGSYQATGTIRAVFITRNGEQRFVFDFDEPPGLLHIAPHEGQGADSSRTVPLDAVVGRRREEERNV